MNYDYVLSEDETLRAKFESKPLKRKLRIALRKRMGVCQTYVEIFQELCSLSNIPCQMITGWTKLEIRDIGKYKVNLHAWAKVMVNEKWELVDPTWGDLTSKSNYFADPKKFYLTHYPENEIKRLSLRGFTVRKFFNLPMMFEGYYLNVEDLDDDAQKGKQHVTEGDSLRITFTPCNKVHTISVFNSHKDRELEKARVVRHNGDITIIIPFPKPGYFEPIIYLNKYAALAYQVYVDEKPFIYNQ